MEVWSARNGSSLSEKGNFIWMEYTLHRSSIGCTTPFQPSRPLDVSHEDVDHRQRAVLFLDNGSLGVNACTNSTPLFVACMYFFLPATSMSCSCYFAVRLSHRYYRGNDNNIETRKGIAGGGPGK
jgi:hypothetical protein